ncbi:hypothetical protein J4526_01825 [Desulfurococcaceae archaeon MEX13E-LK6-19]|nr:hypothetical protein J4526_01825 [Desulfurococcaceae archaeon MEX13E-LK6-19]
MPVDPKVVLLVEYIQRKVDDKLRELKIPDEIRQKINYEIEKIKQTLIEYGLAQIEKELGI